MANSASITYESLSEVPEALRTAAAEKEGKYVVSVVPAAEVKEFRENNIALSKERDAMNAAMAQYEQVTGVPFTEIEEGKLGDFAKVLESLRDTKQRVDDGKLVEETSLEEASAQRVTDVTNSFKKQLEDMAKDRDAHKNARSQAERDRDSMLVENVIRMAASDPEVAMLDKAVAMIMPAAMSVFRAESGKIVPKEADGTVIYGNDGITAMSPKEWLLKQREENDFLFKSSRGGGARSSSDTTSGKMSYAELQKLRPAERMKLARAGKA